MSSSAQVVSGACAFIYRDARPSRVAFDRTADPLLATIVSDLDLGSYCVDENKPVSTVLSYHESELVVIGVAHRHHTVVVAWHTPLFMDLLAIIQGQRYDSPDGLRNSITAGIPAYNPKAPTRQLHAYANYPFVPLVRAFGYDGLRMLLALASSNKTIIFIGDALSVPSLCCFGLRAVLQPLEWLGLFAPVCDPFSIANTIYNEVAIVGTHSSAVPSILMSGKPNAFIANCATGSIAPVVSSAIVYVFPPSEKLKTALGDGSDLAEGIYNYWATHCIGQYRKGLCGRAFDPFKCLFPTTAGSSREHLARNLSATPSFGRWLTAIAQDESKSTFVEYCSRQFPELYPGTKSKGPSVLGLGLFAKAKQTIRSMTTDVDVRLGQYMTSQEVFGGFVQSGSSDSNPFFGAPLAGEPRLPLDCLINFDAYHKLLTPSFTVTAGLVGETSPSCAVPAAKAASPRRTGMSMKRDGPPKTMSIVASPAGEGEAPVGTAPSSAPVRSSTPPPTGAVASRPSSPPPNPDAHRAVLDLSELRKSPSSSSAPPAGSSTVPAPSNMISGGTPLDNQSPMQANGPTGPRPEAAQPQQPTPAPVPTPPPQPCGKYDAFAELEKLAVKPSTPPPEEQPKTFTKLDDFFS